MKQHKAVETVAQEVKHLGLTDKDTQRLRAVCMTALKIDRKMLETIQKGHTSENTEGIIKALLLLHNIAKGEPL
jgi:phosphoheptose isomerase